MTYECERALKPGGGVSHLFPVQQRPGGTYRAIGERKNRFRIKDMTTWRI